MEFKLRSVRPISSKMRRGGLVSFTACNQIMGPPKPYSCLISASAENEGSLRCNACQITLFV